MSDTQKFDDHHIIHKFMGGLLTARALAIAARFHAGQNRKSQLIPYIIHPVRVCVSLTHYGITDDGVLAAALLHDVIENTSLTPLDIESAFNVKVAAWVVELTEKKTELQREDEADPDSPCNIVKRPWRVRKEEAIEVARNGSWPALAIRMADCLDNLMSILFVLTELEADHHPRSFGWDALHMTAKNTHWYNGSIFNAAKERLAKETDICPNGVRAAVRRMLDDVPVLMAKVFPGI